MNELEMLRQLGTRLSGDREGSLDGAPDLDVAASVIRRIRQRPASVVDRRLSLVTAGACAFSAMAVLIAWTAGASPLPESLASLAHAAIASTDPEAVLRVFEP